MDNKSPTGNFFQVDKIKSGGIIIDQFSEGLCNLILSEDTNDKELMGYFFDHVEASGDNVSIFFHEEQTEDGTIINSLSTNAMTSLDTYITNYVKDYNKESTYGYNLTNRTLVKLQDEIKASSIGSSYLYVKTFTDSVRIVFSKILTDSEKTVLDNIIANHVKDDAYEPVDSEQLFVKKKDTEVTKTELTEVLVDDMSINLPIGTFLVTFHSEAKVNGGSATFTLYKDAVARSQSSRTVENSGWQIASILDKVRMNQAGTLEVKVLQTGTNCVLRNRELICVPLSLS